MFWVLNGAHDLEDLVARENPGQFVFRARAADIGEGIISAIEPHVEEFEGTDGLVHRRTRDALFFDQVEQVSANVVGVEASP